MISTLTGIVREKLGDQVVLDVHGVGYGLLVTNEDYSGLTDTTTKLYVYEHIRENSHDLFGFINLETKLLFEQLLGVNGVGPRMALSILNVGNVEAVKQAIASGDIRSIQVANGVGKRIAERIVVELKDKVGLPSNDLASTGLLQGEALALKDDAALALVSLGYSAFDAVESLKSIDTKLSTEERVKQALKGVKK